MKDGAVDLLLICTHQDGPAPAAYVFTVGLPLSSSTGGAVTAAAVTNGVGTTLRVFRENVGTISTRFTDGTPRWRKHQYIIQPMTPLNKALNSTLQTTA
jgi:hypothetical protein